MNGYRTTDSAEAERLADAVAGYLLGDEVATADLFEVLEPQIRHAVAGFLPALDLDVEDVVQETLIAVLGFLRQQGEFSGNLVRFAVAIARNRCRNLFHWRQRRPQVSLESLAEWIANPDRSPLDVLLEEETLDVLQRALDTLGPECRDLLRSFYLEGLPIREIQRRSGLATVQGVYYRRQACLKEAFRLLKNRLGGC